MKNIKNWSSFSESNQNDMDGSINKSSDIIMGKGTLVFDPQIRTNKQKNQSSWKRTAMVIVDDDTYQYYQWMIQKRYPFIQGVLGDTSWLNPPLRGTHVTIINDRIDGDHKNKYDELKEKYEGKEIYFFFNWDGLRNNGEHIYFKVECPMGQQIRDEGGLGDPYFGFHMTIGLVPKESVVKKQHNLSVQKYMMKY